MSRSNNIEAHKGFTESQLDKGAYLPTEEEIRQRCLEIQSTWSDRDEQTRAGAFAASPVDLLELADPKLGRNRTYLRGD